jgi:hypothetical protein
VHQNKKRPKQAAGAVCFGRQCPRKKFSMPSGASPVVVMHPLQLRRLVHYQRVLDGCQPFKSDN